MNPYEDKLLIPKTKPLVCPNKMQNTRKYLWEDYQNSKTQKFPMGFWLLG